jgi:hypothetical protein
MSNDSDSAGGWYGESDRHREVALQANESRLQTLRRRAWERLFGR